MQRLFGIPLDVLTIALLVLVAASFGVIAVLAVRNRIFLRLGVRNVRRRKGRSALIVAGLMLATAIISSALATGDTMGHTVRASVLQALGQTDEMVSVAGAKVDPMLDVGGSSRTTSFDQVMYAEVRDAASKIPQVDGIAPAILEPLAAQDLTSRQTEPRVTLFGSDPASLEQGFSPIRAHGQTVSLADLGPGEVFLNQDGADALQASPGDQIVLFGSDPPTTATVRDVVTFHGAGTDGAAALAGLPFAQQIVREAGRLDHVLISNQGGETSGASHTDAVVDALTPAVAQLGMEVRPVKHDGLNLADEQGNAFLGIFSTFGTFSIAAGILLIFLIFVMLAAERRTEMGVARAVGTQRGHLIQTFLFEGAAYDVLAAAVGAILGLGVAYLMVEAVGSALSSQSSIEITHQVRLSSLGVAFGLGIVLTLLVVSISAWRVSVLNIVTAIRNLPTPIVRKARRSHWIRGLAAVALGALFAVVGVSSGQATPFMLGVSIAIAGLIPVARALGMADRTAFTLAGLALVVWWLLPLDLLEPITGDLAMDFSIWIVAGLMVVLGATWTVMNNADLILKGVTRLAGRVRSVAPVVRMAVAYPLRSRARTGMTLAMFMLVVFTLVTGTAISGSFVSSFDNLKDYGGGFDVRAISNPVRPIDDMGAAIKSSNALPPGQVEAVGNSSVVPMEAHQVGTSQKPADYVVRGVDRSFLDTTTYGLGTIAKGYDSAADVWKALATRPGLAVVDAFVVPHRNVFGQGPLPDLQIQGLYYEDSGFDPVKLDLRDRRTGASFPVTVIGVLRDSAPYEMAGITTSQATMAPLGESAAPTVHYLKLAPGVDPVATATKLESAFLANGIEAKAMSEMLDDAVGASWTINRLMQGFIGLGLVVGVVALGVISARSVVERKQQIGVLRAIGFQPGMVRLGFLLEASFISLAAIVVGSVMGLIMAYNVVAFVGHSQNVAFSVPWVNLVIIFVVVELAALASTLLPALRGSRVYPAEALRYE